MRIAVYHDLSWLQRWSWSELLTGKIALSGTDANLLWLVHDLASSGEEVLLFVRQAPEDSAGPLVTRRVAGILDAIACARGANADVALFVDTMDEQMLLGMTSCEVQRLPVVVWCQNGPNPANADAFWKSTWCRRVVVVSATQADDLLESLRYIQLPSAICPIACTTPRSECGLFPRFTDPF